MRVTYASGKEGYIDISSDTIMKLSDADLPIVSGWEKVSQSDANTPFKNDGMCDVETLKKLVQTVAAKSWLPEEYEDEDALRDYLKNDAELRATLQGFVCHAPTEWDSSQNETRYAALNEPDGFYGQQKQMNPTGTGYSDFLALLKKFQFWDVSGLPSQELWFFHPLKFLRVFRRCNWLSPSEMNQIYAESNYSILHKDGSTYKNQYRLSINKVFRKYGLNNGVRMSHFFGQVAIESAHLMAVRETSISVPVAIRTNHISVMPEPNGYLQAPPANAADVQYFVTKYEGKTALGNTDTGDGVKFRGRGLKQLTGRYNYSKYWEFRGWSVGGPYNPTWFSTLTNGHHPPGPIIDHPEIVGNSEFNCADTGGFFWSLYKVAKAADGGITQTASYAVSALVNYYDHESPPRRWAETQLASQILED
jgi:predicted chitinase